MFYVYVLQNPKTLWLYTGLTNNVERRIMEHNQGQTPSTRGRGPFKLVHLEKYPTRSLAYRRERFLKSGKGREELARILSSDETRVAH